MCSPAVVEVWNSLQQELAAEARLIGVQPFRLAPSIFHASSGRSAEVLESLELIRAVTKQRQVYQAVTLSGICYSQIRKNEKLLE